MTKSEAQQIIKLRQWRNAELADAKTIARALSALIRAARTNKSRAELTEYAQVFNVADHPEFIV